MGLDCLETRLTRLFQGRCDAAGFGGPLLHWRGLESSEYAWIRTDAEQRARQPIRWTDPLFAASALRKKVQASQVRGCGREATTGDEIYYSARSLDLREVNLGLEHGLSHSLLFEYPEESGEADAWYLTGERAAPSSIVAGWPLADLVREVPWLPPWFLAAWLDGLACRRWESLRVG